MANPRVPTNVKILRGTDKQHPGRLNVHEPKDDRPIGDAPESLNDAERRAWNEIVSCAIPGVLFRADRIAVESAARLVAKMRASNALAADYSNLRGLLSQMAMTPADRSKIIVPPEVKKENPFSKFG